MKKSISTIAAIVSLILLSNANAANMPSDTDGMKSDRAGKAQARDARSAMQMFRGLSLNSQQKEDIKALFKQVKADNSVFQADRKNSFQDMQYVMQLPAWDEEAALQVIDAHIEKSQQAKLNIAKAKHAAYQLLDNSQKEQLSQRAEEWKSKRAEKADENKADRKKISTSTADFRALLSKSRRR